MRRMLLLLGPVLGLCAVFFPRGPQSDVDAGTAIRLAIPELVEHAQLVFEGRVLEVTRAVGTTGLIESEYVIDVLRTFKGSAESARRVRLPGGVLPSGDGLLLPGMPVISLGEDLILFLTGPSASGARMPVGLSQGKLRVESSLSGAKRLSRRHGALSMVDPNSGALIESAGSEVFGYAEVIAEIYAAALRGDSQPRSAQGEQR